MGRRLTTLYQLPIRLWDMELLDELIKFPRNFNKPIPDDPPVSNSSSSGSFSLTQTTSTQDPSTLSTSRRALYTKTSSMKSSSVVENANSSSSSNLFSSSVSSTSIAREPTHTSIYTRELGHLSPYKRSPRFP